MKSVKIAEKQIIHDSSSNKVYKGSSGLNGFCYMISDLLFSTRKDLVNDGRVLSFQTIGGTGAIRLSAEMINQINSDRGIWVSNPTWDNHKDIFEYLGMKVDYYPYKGTSRGLDFQSMLEGISKIPESDVIILHGCGHNPTGFDLTEEQWKKVLEIIKERKLLPIIDMAYHGLAKGLQNDTYCIELFSSHLDEMFIAYSCSKNFGLYSDRIGALVVLAKDQKSCSKVKLQLARLARLNFSSPAIHGALIVNKILSSVELKRIWQDEISDMSIRSEAARKMLIKESQRQKCINSFVEVGYGVGLFSIIPIKTEGVEILRNNFGIYILNSGRINVSGLNENNVEYFVSSAKSLLND